jgi:hypothetical protein
MQLGNDWSAVNLGIRFRQKRAGTWSAPDQLTAPPTVSFGLAGDGDTGPRYAVQTTGATWNRMAGPLAWWTVPVSVAEIGGPFSAALRVGDSDEIAGAWYVRFTRINGGLIVSAFLPQTMDTPDEAAFADQLDQEDWQTSIFGHTGYVEHRVTVAGPIATILENVGIRSTAPNYVSSALRAIEWSDVRIVRLS